MENLKIRQAKFSDLSNAKELFDEVVDSLDYKDDFDVNIAVKNYHNIMRNDNSYMLIAELDDNVLGFVNFSIRQNLLQKGYSGLIEELIVKKEFENKELGSTLLSAAIDECKNFGCKEIEVNSASSNLSAMNFYKKHGFVEKGILLEKDL